MQSRPMSGVENCHGVHDADDERRRLVWCLLERLVWRKGVGDSSLEASRVRCCCSGFLAGALHWPPADCVLLEQQRNIV